MKLRLLAVSLIISAVLSGGMVFASSKSVPSSFVYQAVNKYKNHNYTGCIQDMDYVIKNGRPTDIVYYYKALSYAKLGMKAEARESYEAALNITQNRVLSDYATQAISCIDDSSTCDSALDSSDITTFIKSNQFMHPDVKAGLEDKAIGRVKDEINGGKEPSPEDLKYLNYDNSQPTDKEIADAVRTLSKLGINPLAGLNAGMYQNPELMQINAMFGNQNNNNNSMMNLMPIFNGMQNGTNGNPRLSKDFVQTYMMSQMLPNFNFSNNDK